MKLCYVTNRLAFFADRDPHECWGDDWNDAPYEHNAGYPYGHAHENGVRVPVRIVVVRFSASLETPADRAVHGNSGYSVDDINHGAVAWLFSRHPPVAVYAGTTLEAFREAIATVGGTIDLEEELEAHYARNRAEYDEREAWRR